MKKTKKQYDIKQFLPYWKALNVILDAAQQEIFALEKRMELELGIKDVEFFFLEGNECAGIGSADRQMELIHSSDLDKALEKQK